MIVGLFLSIVLISILFVWYTWGAGNITCPADSILVVYNDPKLKDNYEIITQGSFFFWPRRQHYVFLPLRYSSSLSQLEVIEKAGHKMIFSFDFAYQMSNKPKLAIGSVKHLIGLSDNEIKAKVTKLRDSEFSKSISGFGIEEIRSADFLENYVIINIKIKEALNAIGIEVTKNSWKEIRKESLQAASVVNQLDSVELEKQERKRNIEKKKIFITRFPSYEDVFLGNLEVIKKYLFPLLTLDLGAIHKDWKGRKIHLLDFEEDPYYELRYQYFTEYCKDAMIGFYLKDDKYEFMSDLRYFEVSEEWKEYLAETSENFHREKSSFEKRPDLHYDFQFGGTPEWWQSSQIPLDPDGVPMTFITQIDLLTRKHFLFYSHEHQIAVQLYQIT